MHLEKTPSMTHALRVACAVLMIMALPANAENGDQAPSRKDTPKVSINSEMFSFSKGLDSIMKPTPNDAGDKTAPKPTKKPKAASTKKSNAKPQEHAAIPPKPTKKPNIKQKPKTKTKTPDLNDIAQSVDTNESLSNKDAERYKTIFALQEKGNMDAANKEIEKLDNKILYGYVLAQRYLHPSAYTTDFKELQDWLTNYADLPISPKIYELAERKRPKGNNTRLKDPQTKIRITRRAEPTMIVAKRYASARSRSSEEAQNVRVLKQTITRQIRASELSAAKAEIEQTTILDSVERDILTARLASAYLYSGQSNQAFSLASKAAQRSGLHVPLAGWVAGIVSWKRGKYTNASKYFETVARSNYASGWTRSAGAYWAARSHMRRGDIKAVSVWLRRAAKSPRTFYGLIATRALGEDFDFNWSMPTFTKDNYKILSADPRGARAIALAKVGELSKAQAELLRIKTRGDAPMTSALLAFAGYAKLPGVAMRLGATPANKQQNLYHDAALYPTGPWRPKSGYKLNAALLNAIMRQESRFDPSAESGSGAKGLMQLMPATAKSVADSDEPDMNDPATNLELGQRYLAQLLSSSRVDNNLLSLLIAYNAGPGNLNKWKKRWHKIDDPLLFIELLPSGETRSYVEHVLANYWIYRLRDKQQTPSLDAIVAGAPVKFAG